MSQGMLDNDDEGQHWGVYVDDRLVGVASLFADGKLVRLRKLAVVDDYQNLGLGSGLLEHLIDQARAQGYDQLWCNIREESLPFYESFGFQRLEAVKQFKGADAYCRIGLSL